MWDIFGILRFVKKPKKKIEIQEEEHPEKIPIQFLTLTGSLRFYANIESSQFNWMPSIRIQNAFTTFNKGSEINRQVINE